MTRPLPMLAICLALVAGQVAGAATGGAQVENTASATYKDPTGKSYGTQSNPTSVSVETVSAILVTPKEPAANPATETFPTGTTIVRTFTIANVSDITDAYQIATLTSGAGRIVSAAFLLPGGATLPITLNSTVSPAIAPGGSIQVSVAIDTTGVAVGTTFPVEIGARTTHTGTVNGLQSDTGRQWGIAAAGATFVNPNVPSLPVEKFVDGQRSVAVMPGSVVTFSVPFKNGGGQGAANITFTDVLAAGLNADPSSAKLNGSPIAATLAGHALQIAIPALAPGATDTVSFNATVAAGVATGSVLANVVTIGAGNAKSVTTLPATVLGGADNIVYDGQMGASAPIAGATVTLVDPTTLRPVQLASTNGIKPNANNANPFLTGADGSYTFALAAAQYGGAPGSAHPQGAGSINYVLLIAAPNYLNRRIGVRLVPDATGILYTVTITSLDGQPVAVGGGFSLTSAPVTFGNIFGAFGNLPLFRAGGLRVTKTADRTIATAGDRIVYTLSLQNATQAALRPLVVRDTLPAGLAYAKGTARVNGIALEPAQSGQTLTWTIATLAPAAALPISYATVVLPQTQAQTQLRNVVTATANGESATADATVQVVGGVFADCYPITGRVFADNAGTHHMTRADLGVPGVRIILEDGSSVVTDRNGRFSFDCVHPGEHALRLDETTISGNVRAFAASFAYDDTRSTVRLVHDVFDAGMLQDVQFALQPVSP